MKKLYILKVGTTYPAIASAYGDFDIWTRQGLEVPEADTCILDIEHGAPLPGVDECSGIVITGSHSMVTENLDWSVKLENWIRSPLEAGIPILGICYGHQLLARAAGGVVNFHPKGEEIGTVRIQLLPACTEDGLFSALPQIFSAHASHSQSVLHLPSNAMRLAFNAHEAYQAFRIGECAWGIQFHPEYSADIMRAYIREASTGPHSAGLNVPERFGHVEETPVAAQVLKNFGRFVERR